MVLGALPRLRRTCYATLLCLFTEVCKGTHSTYSDECVVNSLRHATDVLASLVYMCLLCAESRECTKQPAPWLQTGPDVVCLWANGRMGLSRPWQRTGPPWSMGASFSPSIVPLQ